MESLKLKIYKYDSGKKLLVPFIEGKIPAGFPSPAQDYQEDKIDLNEQLIKHPASTFIIKVIGDSMIEEGICNKSFLIVDRSLEYKKNSIAVVNINGDYTVKKIEKKNNKFFLAGANKNFAPIELNEETELLIFGIVTWVLNPKY